MKMCQCGKHRRRSKKQRLCKWCHAEAQKGVRARQRETLKRARESEWAFAQAIAKTGEYPT